MRIQDKTKTWLAAAGLAMTLVAAPAAQAAVVTQWSIDVTAQFLCATAVFSPGTGGTSCSDFSIRFGTSQGSGQSGIDITGNAAFVAVNTNGAAAPTLEVSHLNRPISGNTLQSVTLSTSLLLGPLSPMQPELPPDTLDFTIRLFNTPNGLDPCPDGDPNGVGVNVNGCSDIFIIDQQSLNFPFVYDTDGPGGDDPVTYFISFFEQGGGLTPLSVEACTNSGVAAPCLGFRTPENEDTTFRFSALITTERVNVPIAPTPALLVLGLGGLAWMRRRTRR